MKETTEETEMWSYRLVWDTMFAPNPFFDMLTLATCKPTIRKSPNTKNGMWIAGWTACTLHNPPLDEYKKVEHINKGEEKLIFLARIDEVLPLNEYWHKYPEKRCLTGVSPNDVRWYGDNIYHTDSNGNLIQCENNNHHGDNDKKRDFYTGKNALICKKFFYFTPDKRIGDIPGEFKKLIHGGIGQSTHKGEKVDRFIEFVTKCAREEGVTNGIVGTLPLQYPTVNEQSVSNSHWQSQPIKHNNKKGCGK